MVLKVGKFQGSVVVGPPIPNHGYFVHMYDEDLHVPTAYNTGADSVTLDEVSVYTFITQRLELEITLDEVAETRHLSRQMSETITLGESLQGVQVTYYIEDIATLGEETVIARLVNEFDESRLLYEIMG